MVLVFSLFTNCRLHTLREIVVYHESTRVDSQISTPEASLLQQMFIFYVWREPAAATLQFLFLILTQLHIMSSSSNKRCDKASSMLFPFFFPSVCHITTYSRLLLDCPYFLNDNLSARPSVFLGLFYCRAITSYTAQRRLCSSDLGFGLVHKSSTQPHVLLSKSSQGRSQPPICMLPVVREKRGGRGYDKIVDYV